MDDRLRETVEDDFCDRHAFEERMEMPIEAEASACRDRKVAKLVRDARFKPPSTCFEGVAFPRERKLGRNRVARLSACERVEACEVVAMISKMGCGKSFLGRTLGDAVCRGLFTACYARLADMMGDLNRCRSTGDGGHCECMDLYKTVQLLIADDFPTAPISMRSAMDLFEIMEAREGHAAAHRLPARARRVMPQDRGRADGRLHPQQDGDRNAPHRPRRAEHARVLREAEEAASVPGEPTRGTVRADWRYQIGLLLDFGCFQHVGASCR